MTPYDRALLTYLFNRERAREAREFERREALHRAAAVLSTVAAIVAIALFAWSVW